jgi:hypothetical protein
MAATAEPIQRGMSPPGRPKGEFFERSEKVA